MKKSSKHIVEFTLLYNRNKVKLFNYVLRMLSDRMVCEDIVQNVFLKLFENLNDIRVKSSVTFWLFKTARNEIYTYLRRKKVRTSEYYAYDIEDIELDSSLDIQREFERKELKDIILNELELLPEEQREVYLLKEYAEMTYKEISAIMEIDENLVKSRLFKTRQKLIKRLEKKLLSDNF